MAKPIDSRRFLRELRRGAVVIGLNVAVDRRRGAGSHYYVIVIDPKSQVRVSFTLADRKEVSPGVQRSIYAWMQHLAKECAVHAAVLAILHALFSL